MTPIERVIADMAEFYSVSHEEVAALLARALNEPVGEPLRRSSDE